MRKLLFLMFLVLTNVCVFAQNAERDSVKTKVRKNVIRVEIGAKSLLAGILYERLVVHKKIDAYISVGSGLGLVQELYKLPSMFNLSFYLTKNKWFLSPVLGVGSFLFVEYKPYPETKERRDAYRNGTENRRYLAQPFTFYACGIIGLSINFSKRWNCQLLYTPTTKVDFIPTVLPTERGHMAGVNIGYKF